MRNALLSHGSALRIAEYLRQEEFPGSADYSMLWLSDRASGHLRFSWCGVLLSFSFDCGNDLLQHLVILFHHAEHFCENSLESPEVISSAIVSSRHREDVVQEYSAVLGRLICR